MLKGIKKSKNPNIEQQERQIIKQKDSKSISQSNLIQDSKQIKEHQIKLFTSNQNNLKQQFIIQEEQQQQQQLISLNTEYKHQSNEQFNQLKQKAFDILEFYKLGDVNQLLNQMKIFESLQQKYYNNQAIQTYNETKSHSNKNQLQNDFKAISSTQHKPQSQKGKFQYNFNYQDDQNQQKQSNRKQKKRSNKSRPIMKSQKIQDYCIYCPDNQQLRLISASNYVYLALPKRKTFHKYWHFILAPVQHNQTSIGLNQDILTQLSNYKKCLLQMFDKKNYLVVFWEQFSQENSHIYIECLAVPFAKGQDFPFFFKQSLQTVEGNWTTHNTLIKIQKEKGGLQRQIPKKINYFYIDFSLGYGYAHVIQNDKFWKRQFCNDIIATALGIQLYEVKTASEFTEQELNVKQQEFKKMWGAYDWTKCL